MLIYYKCTSIMPLSTNASIKNKDYSRNEINE